MLAFSAAITQLQLGLQNITSEVGGYQQFSVELSCDEDALAWPSAQNQWPQLYWQHRDGNETIAACGEVAHFERFAQAHAFVARLPVNWRIWGANDFGAEHSYLFLPRLVWRRSVPPHALSLQ